MRRILMYNRDNGRYHYARFESECGFLEVGSAKLEGNHSIFHVEERFRLLAAGSGTRAWTRTYTTPYSSVEEVRTAFQSWLQKGVGMILLLDVEV